VKGNDRVVPAVKDQKLVTDLEGSYNEEGWAQTPQGKLIIPSCLIWHLVREEHRKRHWGTEALYKHLVREIVARNLYTTVSFFLSLLL